MQTIKEQLEWNKYFTISEKMVTRGYINKVSKNTILSSAKYGTLVVTHLWREIELIDILREMENLHKKIHSLQHTISRYEEDEKKIKDILLPWWDTNDY